MQDKSNYHGKQKNFWVTVAILIMGMGWGNDSDSQTSTTHAGISQATINITNTEKQKALTGKDATQTVAELNRNVSTDKDTSGALQNKFDATRVQNEVDAQTQITQTFGQQAAQAIGTLAQHKTSELKKQAELATTPEQKQQLLDEAAKWDEGGRYRVALHTVAGAMSGGVAGAASAATVAGSANPLGELQNHIQTALKNAGASESVANITSKIISQAAAAGLGGAVGAAAGGATSNAGTGAIAGAATGLNIDANNRQLHPDERKWAKDKAQQFAKYYKEKTGRKITAEQAQNMLLANGYRLVDDLASKGPGGDITAKQFIAEQSGNLFQATAAERANPFLHGNADSSLTPEQRALPGATANPQAAFTLVGLMGSGLTLARLAPEILSWVLSNPIAASNAGIISAETAAGLTSGAITATTLASLPNTTLSKAEQTALRELGQTLQTVAQQKTVVQQQQRVGELLTLFNKTSPEAPLSIAGQRYLPTLESNLHGTAKVFDTSAINAAQLERQVFDYAKELSGGKALAPVMKDGKMLEGRWTTTLSDGTTINVRSISSSKIGSTGEKARWTVDVINEKTFKPLVGQKTVELKFK